MKTEKYLSFSYLKEEDDVTNKYQYITRHPEAYYANNVEALRDELNTYFFDFFFDPDNELTDKHAFLDYHLEQYNGHGKNFMDFLKHSPKRPFDVNDHPGLEQLRWEKRQQYIEDWITERKDIILKKVAKIVPPKLPEPDKRLIVKHKKDTWSDIKIEEWFRREFLFKTFNEKEVITGEDFKTFLHASFAAFEEVKYIPADNKLDVNADGAFLKNLMYRFYKEVALNDNRNKPLREGLAKILKNHFSVFEQQELNTIYRSLHRAYTARE